MFLCLKSTTGANPCSYCNLPKIQQKEIVPLLDGEISIFMKAVQSDEYYRIHVFGLFTGMREGEVLGLSWECINWETNTITIRQQLQQRETKGDFGFFLKAPKHDKKRSIVVPDSVMKLLQEQRMVQNRQKEVADILWCNDWNLVFTKADGSPISRRTVLKHLQKALAKHGITNQTFHGLRHGFATMSIQNGVDPKTLQEHLGHHDAGFTLKQYCFASDKMKRDSAEKCKRE